MEEGPSKWRSPKPRYGFWGENNPFNLSAPCQFAGCGVESGVKNGPAALPLLPRKWLTQAKWQGVACPARSCNTNVPLDLRLHNIFCHAHLYIMSLLLATSSHRIPIVFPFITRSFLFSNPGALKSFVHLRYRRSRYLSRHGCLER